MKTPHKHAAFIKAWADGDEVEFFSKVYKYWMSVGEFPYWEKDYEYRIKPIKTKLEGVDMSIFDQIGSAFASDFVSGPTVNPQYQPPQLKESKQENLKLLKTTELRFVERFKPVIGTNYGGTIRVLQQWWEVEQAGQITPIGEWRDVPLEKEECCGNPLRCMGNCVDKEQRNG